MYILTINGSTLEDVLESHSEKIQQLFMAVRSIMLSTDERIQEEFLEGQKVRMGYYPIAQRNNPIGVLGAAKDHVKLFLHHSDMVNTETLKLEGNGKHSKHVKLYPISNLQELNISFILEDIVEICLSRS